MNPRPLPFRSVAWVLLPLLGACATAPKPLQGEFTVVTPRDIAASGQTGDTVRWGGLVIDVSPEAERTCIQLLSRELTGWARPRNRDASEGRFVACRAGFYDPEVFTPGREVTVVGRVTGLTERPVGDYAYAMPEVAAEVIYLWPERPDYDEIYVHYPPWFDVWPYRYGWYGPYYRPYPIVKPPPSREPPSSRGKRD